VSTEGILSLASVVGGAIASVSGFGIGSVLTPAFSLFVDAKLAVAAVSIPHFVGTLIRFLKLRRFVDRHLIRNFGFASAIGGLGGALLNSYANAPILGLVLGGLLVFAGFMGVTGIADRLKIRGRGKWLAGVASGGFGGLVGNQGGIRSAAMLGFQLSKESFVATATAIALMVDFARMPVYIVTLHERIVSIWPMILISTAGVVLGTFAGARVLRKIPERVFRRIVGAIILGLGIFMFFHTHI
jgi:uncharacterized membrane protein YfcA